MSKSVAAAFQIFVFIFIYAVAEALFFKNITIRHQYNATLCIDLATYDELKCGSVV